MKNLKRYLSFTLVLVMIFMALTACDFGSADPKDTSSGSLDTNGSVESNDIIATDSNETGDIIETGESGESGETGESGKTDNVTPPVDFSEATFAIATNGTIKSAEVISQALSYLQKAVDASYSTKSVCKTDTAVKEGQYTYTFLVGDTRFSQSNKLPSNMKINDYAYQILPDGYIVINGGSSDAILSGVKRFCSDVLKYKGSSAGAKNPELKVGTKYTYTGNYQNKKVTVNGIPLEKFKITVRNGKDVALADKFIKEFGKHNGYSVPITTGSKLTTSDKGVICIGSMTRKQALPVLAAISGYKVYVSNANGNYTAGIVASSQALYTTAVDGFIKKMEVKTTGSNVEITLPDISFQDFIYKYTTETTWGYSSTWTVTDNNKSSEVVADGLTYNTYIFKDKDGHSHAVYALFVDSDKYVMELGLPASGTSSQTVKNQMKNLGSNTVAGINGGLWDTSTGILRGDCVKNGQIIIQGGYETPYIALTKDGTYYIGKNTETQLPGELSNVKTAISADVVLVENGLPVSFHNYNNNTHLEYEHPRTLLGITMDNDLVLVVVDGRQSYSDGATMENAAELMSYLGCHSAVSLDGGGSSEMVVNAGNYSYTTMNSPSDGSSRGVKDSVLIAKK